MKNLFKKFMVSLLLIVGVGLTTTHEVYANGNEYREAKVTAWQLNVRPTPSMQFKPLYTIKKNQVVKVYGETDSGWLRIGEERYIHKGWVKFTNQKTQKQPEQSVAAPSQNTTGNKYSTIKLSSSERDLLARLVRAEAGGESFEGQVAVAHVVFNRMQHKRFPNTLEGVIYQKKQFSPVMNGMIKRPAYSHQFNAVDYALNNPDITDGALFFYAPSLVRSPYMESLKHVKVIGVHHFKTFK